MLKVTSCFSRHRSLIACVAAAVAIGSTGSTVAADEIAYAELNSEYVRIDMTTGATDDIEPLFDTLNVGAFAGGDGSHEYTADAFNSFISIDTETAETSLLGQLDVSGSASGMAWDPVAKKMILSADDAACENAAIYTVDLATAATQSVGAEQGCIKGLAIDTDENVFSIDGAANTLVKFGVGSIGALGFDVGSVQALFFDSRDSLYLIATDQNTGLAGLYAVDTQSGAATLTAPGESGYLAFALAPDPDEIFKNGFQANAGFH